MMHARHWKILMSMAGFVALTGSVRAAPNDPPPIGNPLWIVSLADLNITADRPLFTPSRRGPPRNLANPAPAPVVSNEPLQLSLVGAVVGDEEAIAVFVDKATQSVVRLRTGQSHAGWTLAAVTPREATLKRGSEVRALAIQRNETVETMPAPAGVGPPPPGTNNPAPAAQRRLPPDNL